MIRRHPIACGASAIVIALLWVPLVIVCANALNRDELLVSWQGATTRWFEQAWQDEAVRDSLTVSLKRNCDRCRRRGQHDSRSTSFKRQQIGQNV